MNEAFLHFVWKNLYFQFRDLHTTEGESVHIIKVGLGNTNQGPDFLQAKIAIDGVEWSGSVEIHLTSKEWYEHKHETDEKYNQVVLHVVGKSTGKPIVRQDGTICPEIEIGNLIDHAIAEKYHTLQASKDEILCQSMIHKVEKIYINHWISALAIERVQQKAEKMQAELLDVKYDWAQLAWKLLLGYMGGTINGTTFRELAEIVPYSIVSKYTQNLFQIEALLLGVWIDSMGENNIVEGEEYLQKCWQEYLFLKEKHQITIPYPLQFSYFRMRPVAFPEIRLAQTANLLHQFPNLITLFSPQNHATFLKSKISVSDYWLTHYKIGEISPSKSKNLGKDQKEVLLINIFLPLAFLYGSFHGNENQAEEIENSFMKLAPESNSVITSFEKLGISCENALHSQGLIQLKKNYCDAHKCLICSIGNQLIKL